MDGPDTDHQIPEGVSRETVEAVGKVSEALETVERARGHLYAFHQLTGTADLALGEAVSLLREAGHEQIAEEIEQELLGCNIIHGRWTFQLVEEYDDGYWSAFRRTDRAVREQLVAGRRHLFEAALKEDRRSHGDRGHEATP